MGDCVVGQCHLYPLHSWQDILLTFAEMELDNTTMFPPGTNVMFTRSMEEPILVQVVGNSEHGDAYRRITYDRDGKTILHDRASVQRLSMLQFLCAQMCVYGGGAVFKGGGGHFATVPQGWWGTVFPGVGNDKGGGGVLTMPGRSLLKDHVQITGGTFFIENLDIFWLSTCLQLQQPKGVCVWGPLRRSLNSSSRLAITSYDRLSGTWMLIAPPPPPTLTWFHLGSRPAPFHQSTTIATP